MKFYCVFENMCIKVIYFALRCRLAFSSELKRSLVDQTIM